MRLCSLQGAFRFQIFLLRCASKELSGKVVKSHVMHAAGGLLAAKCAGCVVCGACLVAVALPLRFRAAVPSLFSRFLEPLNLAQATGGAPWKRLNGVWGLVSRRGRLAPGLFAPLLIVSLADPSWFGYRKGFGAAGCDSGLGGRLANGSEGLGELRRVWGELRSLLCCRW